MTNLTDDDFLAIERGASPRSPEAAAEHATLVEALGTVGQDHREHQDDAWMDAVLGAVEPEAASRPSRLRWVVAAGIALAAAALLAVLLRPSGPDVPEHPVAFALTRVDGANVVRGRDLAPHDAVHVRWDAGYGLWVFFNDAALLLRCPGSAACAVDGAEASVELTLEEPGRYTFIRVGPDVPAPTGVLDEDVARALDGGHVATIEADLDVR